MGLTFQLDPTFYGDFTPANLQSRQLHLVNGYFSYDSASSTALTITAAYVGLNRLCGFLACPKGNAYFQVSPGTDFTVQAITSNISSVSVAVELGSLCATASVAVGSITSIPFLAWGYR
jgi:hypothetical protein